MGSRGASSGVRKGTETIPIPQAKTIEEANKIAVDLGLAQNADFGKLDVGVANEMIAETQAMHELFPDLPPMYFIGSMQQQVKMEKAMSQRLRRARSIPPNVYAWCYDEATYLGKLSSPYGIGLNEKWFYDNKPPILLEDNIRTKYHPEGTFSIKGIVAHELGHRLDHVYGISRDTKISSLYSKYHERGSRSKTEILSGGQKRYTGKMASALSQYADTNIQEFIAEAWSEYRASPKPRPLAREVGTRIHEIIKGAVKKK